MSSGADQVTDWYHGIPIVTKFLFTAAFVITCCGNMNVIPIQSCYITYELVWKRFEIWRLFTGVFFIGKFSFNFLTSMLFLYRYSSALESEEYEARTADYAFAIVFQIVVLWMAALFQDFYPLYFIGKSLIMGLVYIWSRINKDVTVTFFFGIKFQGIMLPWVLMLFHMLMGAGIGHEIIGLLVGHLYYFLEYIYPEHNRGAKLISTPRVFHDYLPRQATVTNRGYGTSFQRVEPINVNSGTSKASGSSPSTAAMPNPWKGGGNKLGGN